jgi:allophanate hydrolase
MAEGQTTGGYPKIATVIGADLPRLAQLRPGTRLSFKAVTLDEAENALVTSRKATRAMLSSLGSADPIQPTSERLLSVNLISGVWPEDEASPNG